MAEVLLKVPDVALEQARMMLERARWGATKFQKLDRAATMRIVDAVAAAGHAKAQHYAEWAVRETGMGVVEHKRIKNEACSKGLVATYAAEDFVAPRIDAAQEDRRAAAPGRRDLCPDPGDQSGRHHLLQDDPRPDDAQRDHPQPASGRQSLLGGCRTHAGRGGEGSRRAGRRHPGAGGTEHTADREDHRRRTHRSHRRDGGTVGRQGVLSLRQSGDGGRARQRARAGRRQRRHQAGGKAHRRFEVVRQFHPLHQ